MNSGKQDTTDKHPDPDFICDPRKLTFSQAQGYEEIPKPLQLEDLPREARTDIWNTFYSHLAESSQEDEDFGGIYVFDPWREILYEKHLYHDHLPLDEWGSLFVDVCDQLRDELQTMPFNKVFDLIQFVLRHPECPPLFISSMKKVFFDCRLAYSIDENDPPTIIPTATREEGSVILESMKTLHTAGLGGSAAHLRKASECINENDWAGSIRESIHAVESVACQIAPGKTGTLTRALSSIEKHKPFHPSLKSAVQKLYGYASNEQGIRHALLDHEEANPGRDEALFMLGACASFASYLWRKHVVETP